MVRPAGLLVTETLFGLPSNVWRRLPRLTCAVAAVFVSAKTAEVDPPASVAVTLYGPPTMELAVNAGAVATPLASVATVVLPENEPLAPFAGAAKVTRTPLLGIPDSFTVACKGAAKTLPTVADCGVPAVALIA